MQNPINEISSKVRDFGVTSYANWLNDQDLKKSIEIVKNINCPKADFRGIFETNYKFRLIELFLKFKFKKFKQTNYFSDLSKKLGLKKIANEIFHEETKLIRIDCYISPISKNPTIGWHVDHGYSGMKNVTKFNNPKDQTIKFFFYLSDVFSNNGCLGYIPKSHIIAVALRKGIYEGKLKYTPYWSLRDFKKTILIKENYAYLKKNMDINILDEFLSKTDESVFKNGLDSKYDYQPIKAGGALIFNDSGLHRGSETRMTERLVLRLFYQPKKIQ